MPDNKVTDIAAGVNHSVLVLTDKGLAEMHFEPIEVLPPDELPISRHNSNRFDLDGGDDNGSAEYNSGDI